MTWAAIELERRYADPAHEPGWTTDNRPPWAASDKVRREFAAWASAQLDELERRVRAERAAEIEPMLPDLFRALAKGMKAALPRLADRLAGARAVKSKAGVNELVTQETREATGQAGKRGRTASGADPNSPAAKAARDLWRLRHVILPRLWPEGAKAGWGLTNEELATIAAARHPGATATAALSWYENERLASL